MTDRIARARSTRAAGWIVQLGALAAVAAGAHAQSGAAPPGTDEPAPAAEAAPSSTPATPTPAAAPPALAAPGPTPEPAPATAPATESVPATSTSIDERAAEAQRSVDATAAVADGTGAAAADPSAAPVLTWKARVMTGFELERVRPSAEQGGSEVTDYGVFLDQARIELNLEYELLQVEVSAELADAIRPRTSASAFDQPPYVRDAFLDARLHKALRVRAGRFKRPFSALELRSSGKLPFRGRGLANDLIVEDAQWGDRALGLMLWGKLPRKVSYYAAASNPEWAPDGDLESNGIDTLGRLEWDASDALAVGVNGGHKLKVRPGDDTHANAIGADVRVRTGGLFALVDFIAGQLPDGAAGAAAGSDTPWAYGAVAYASYDVPLRGLWALQPVLLFEYADADADYSNTEAVRAIAGLNVIWNEQLRLMPQVELVRPISGTSSLHPWPAGETYYLMLSAQL